MVLFSDPTRTGIYENQLISAIPHERTPEQYDVISLTLNLRQALFVAPENSITPAEPEDTTTIDRGQQGIIGANATQIALAIAVFMSANKYFWEECCMINIPLQAIPSQSLSILLNEQQYDLRIHDCGNSVMSIDVTINNSLYY